MNHFARIPLCAGIGVVLVSVLVLLLIKLGGPRTDENLNMAEWVLKLSEQLQRRAELDTRGGPVFRRTFEKRRVVQELVAHRLTLRQAVQEFRALDEDVAQVQPNEESRPRLDEQSLRHSVIIWVEAELAHHPDQAKQVVDELEHETSEQPLSGG